MGKIAVALLCLFAAATSALAQDDEKAAERKKEIDTQRKQADELWKSVLTGTQTAARKETANFLLYGTVSEDTLETIGKGLEKALVNIKKAAAVKASDTTWPGKAVVHVCKDRPDFRALYSKLKKESADKDEAGTYSHDRDATSILVGPQDGKRPQFEVEGVIQLAGATLSKKTPRLPGWFMLGFSRAAAYKHAPTAFNAERQKARLLVRQGRSAKDVWTEDKLSADEAPILAASLFDFLINSPQMSKRWPEVLDTMGEETPFETALKAANLTADAVDAAWRAWAGRLGSISPSPQR
jgi:hypothetical protein